MRGIRESNQWLALESKPGRPRDLAGLPPRRRRKEERGTGPKLSSLLRFFPPPHVPLAVCWSRAREAGCTSAAVLSQLPPHSTMSSPPTTSSQIVGLPQYRNTDKHRCLRACARAHTHTHTHTHTHSLPLCLLPVPS